jgi:hypothetical protein
MRSIKTTLRWFFFCFDLLLCMVGLLLLLPVFILTLPFAGWDKLREWATLGDE